MSVRDKAVMAIIEILHGHGATVGAGGETEKWEDCEYAAIHEMAAKRIVTKLETEGLL